MPFSSNGTHSLPVGYQAVTGQTIQATQHNPPLEDLSAALSQTLVRDGRAAMTGDLNMGEFGISNMRAAEADDEAVNKEQMDQSLPPIGIVIDYAGSTAPTGWLLCYGQAISRTTYAALFAIIGTTYGTGDGSTTFNLPDLRGRTIAGKDNMGGTSANRLTGLSGGIDGDTLGATGGAETHTLTSDQMPTHDHGGASGSDGAHTHTLNSRASSTAIDVESPSDTIRLFSTASGDPDISGGVNTASAHTHTIAAAGSGSAHNNMQPTFILNKIIRAT